MYIVAMTDVATGPLADIIAARLTAALAPARLLVTNDSGRHAGHAGDDGSGESHWSVAVESAAFVGQSRVARQRLVNAALADLLAGIASTHSPSRRPLREKREWPMTCGTGRPSRDAASSCGCRWRRRASPTTIARANGAPRR